MAGVRSRSGSGPGSSSSWGPARPLNSLLDNAPVGFGFFDQELRFLRLNPALAEINGLPIEAHLGRPLTEVLPDLAGGAPTHSATCSKPARAS